MRHLKETREPEKVEKYARRNMKVSLFPFIIYPGNENIQIYTNVQASGSIYKESNQGSWQLAVGSSQLAVGSSQLAVGGQGK